MDEMTLTLPYDVSNKRLLVLGGVSLACDIVNKAHEMGVYVMVTDYLPDSPAKKLADESFMVSTTDVDSIIRLCREKQVDGVFTGYIDSLLPYCCEVCEHLGLPFYATQEQLKHTINKRYFKDICIQCGVPVAKDYNLDDLHIPFPIVVKPADNSGSRGFAICHSRQELETAYQNALTLSKSQTVIIEDYLEGREVTLYYTVQCGEVFLSLISERYHQPGLPQVPAATLFFREYCSLYTKEMHDSVVRFVRLLGMENGSFILQAYYTRDGFKCMEIIHRLSGIRQYVVASHANGIDIVKMHILHALTGEFSGWSAKDCENPDIRREYAYITFLLNKPGRIGSILGYQEIENHPNVIDILQSYSEGDVISESAFGTLSQIFARCYIVADDKQTLASLITSIGGMLRVTNESGENMLLPRFDPQRFMNV